MQFPVPLRDDMAAERKHVHNIHTVPMCTTVHKERFAYKTFAFVIYNLPWIQNQIKSTNKLLFYHNNNNNNVTVIV